MANRITIQDGYEMPFDAFGRAKKSRKRRGSKRRMPAAVKKQQSKMRACAAKWRKSGTGKYQNFMSKCLSK